MRVKRKSIAVYNNTEQNVLESKLLNIIPIAVVWVKKGSKSQENNKNPDSCIQTASSSSP